MGQYEYNNKVELYYILNNTETEIPFESISAITMNCNFDTSNMPAIFVSLNLEYKIYNTIVTNLSTGLFRLTIKKYNRNSISSLQHGDVSGLFTYIIPSNLEYNKNIIGGSDNNSSYKSGTIALLSLDIINNNRMIINNVIKNSNYISIIHKYTMHMNTIIEPLDNTEIKDRFIIPPISTITGLLEFLNDEKALYNTRYRYFRDFDRTYLLSSSGKAVKDEDNEYSTVLVNVLDPNNSSNSSSSGLDIDKRARAYILNVDANDTSMALDTSSDLQFNKIKSFKYKVDDNVLNLGEQYLNNSLREDGNDRDIIMRYSPERLNSIVSSIDSKSVILNIIRSDMDSSILTPNKEYVVKNYEDLKEYDGRYLLSYKKEIMIQQGEDFISSVAFGLRKVME